MLRACAIAALLCVCFLPALAPAQVPSVMPFQGRLTDNTGAVIPANSTVIFEIFTAASAGSSVWGPETHTVTPANGIVSVFLGAGNTPVPITASVFSSPDRYLQITVNGQVMSPRIRMGTTGFTFVAQTVPDNAITSAKIQDGSVGSADVTDGSLTATDIGTNIVSSINGVSNDGGNVDIVPGSGLSITPNDAANTITIAHQAPSYFVSGNLNTVSVNVTSAWTKIDDFLQFTKAGASSSVEVILNSRAGSGTFAGGAIGVLFAVRIDGLEATLSNEAAITTSSSTQFVSIFGAFPGLAAGLHTVSVWARTSVGSSSGVVLDPGGWGGRVIVKETL